MILCFHSFILSEACQLLEVTGKESAPGNGPINAVELKGNPWLLPEDVKGNPMGRITYFFTCEVNINGFYVENVQSENCEEDYNGTNDFTIYAGESPDNWELVHEGELSRCGKDTVGGSLNLNAKAIGLVVKSTFGNQGGLQYFWYY